MSCHERESYLITIVITKHAARVHRGWAESLQAYYLLVLLSFLVVQVEWVGVTRMWSWENDSVGDELLLPAVAPPHGHDTCWCLENTTHWTMPIYIWTTPVVVVKEFRIKFHSTTGWSMPVVEAMVFRIKFLGEPLADPHPWICSWLCSTPNSWEDNWLIHSCGCGHGYMQSCEAKAWSLWSKCLDFSLGFKSEKDKVFEDIMRDGWMKIEWKGKERNKEESPGSHLVRVNPFLFWGERGLWASCNLLMAWLKPFVSLLLL